MTNFIIKPLQSLCGPNLRVLTLPDFAVAPALLKPFALYVHQHLRELHITNLTLHNDHCRFFEFIKLLKGLDSNFQQRHLKVLSIKSTATEKAMFSAGNLQDLILLHLMKTLPQLERLEFQTKIPFSQLAVFTHFKKLKELKLTMSFEKSGYLIDFCNIALSQMPTLQVLDLTFCSY